MRSTRPSILQLGALALALAAAGAAQAGSAEEGFRGFIEKLKASGKASTQAVSAPKGAAEITKPSIARRTDSLPLGKDQHVLFVADGCKSCAAVAARVDKRKLGKVEVMNISTNATAREAFALTRAKGVPAMLVGGNVISGYSDKLYDRALVESYNDKGVSQQGTGS